VAPILQPSTGTLHRGHLNTKYCRLNRHPIHESAPLPDSLFTDLGITTVSGLTRTDLHGAVVSSLRDLIVTGVLTPGARLDETKLCKTLGLSRTPLREAVKVLASEQLLQIIPHRGTYVAPLVEAETADLFEVMASLDSLVGATTATRATAADLDRIAALQTELRRYYAARDRILYFQVNQTIHRALLDATRMAPLVNAYSPLLHRVQRARTLANVSTERQAESLAEHELILEALLKRDGDRLARLLPAHTRATGHAVLAAMRAGRR
jgi:DNA-binding GntR family transcriptional regulator